jgi:chromosome segregation ATPase
MLDERYATQTKAVDAAFLAQQTAMQTALTAARESTQSDLLAAKEAVGKAEVAAEKRFESVNEFRAQLADQAGTFMPRSEAMTIVQSNTERIQAINTQLERRLDDIREQMVKLEQRLERREGEASGASTQSGAAQVVRNQAVALAGVILVALSVAVTVIIAVTR